MLKVSSLALPSDKGISVQMSSLQRDLPWPAYVKTIGSFSHSSLCVPDSFLSLALPTAWHLMYLFACVFFKCLPTNTQEYYSLRKDIMFFSVLSLQVGPGIQWVINRYSLNDQSHLFIHPTTHLHSTQHLLRTLQCLLKGGKGSGESKEWKMKMEKNRVGRKIGKERTSEKKKRRTVWLMSEQMNRFYRGNMSPWEIIGKTANVIKANWCEKEDTR